MHLRAKPSSEGARRLAWWIGQQGDDGVELFAYAINHHVSFVDRLLDGELIPGRGLAIAIVHATGEAVLPRDWMRDAEAGWFVQPEARPVLARAA